MVTPVAPDGFGSPNAPDDVGLAFPYAEIPIDSARQEIRLLTLHAGEWGAPVRCTVFSKALDDKPEYKALSYTWGKDETLTEIILNGQIFPVYKNLFNILQRLRRRGPEGRDMVLWIDAICINQARKSKKALTERTSQVQMMASIYSHCNEVLVWLGNCYTSRSTPVRFLTRQGDNKALLQEYVADFERDPTILDYCFHLACFLYLLKEAGKTGKTVNFTSYEMPPFWESAKGRSLSRYKIPPTTENFKRIYSKHMYLLCRYLSESPWTMRLWTLQEYGVSPQVTFCFGTAAVPQERFSDILTTITPSPSNEDSFKYWSSLFSVSYSALGQALHHHVMVRNFAAVFRRRVPRSRLSPRLVSVFRPSVARLARGIVRRGFVKMAAETTVFEIVATFRMAQASEGEDKVFAVVSLMAFLGLKVPDNLKVNYALTTSEIYLRVSEDQILRCKGNAEAYEPLAPLRFARRRNQYTRPKDRNNPLGPKLPPLDLPSWAVDWTSYPWGDQHISRNLTSMTFIRHHYPEQVAWLEMEAESDIQDAGRVEDQPAGLVSAARYNATKELVGASPSISGRVLTVSGIAVGRVTEVFDLADGIAAWKMARAWPIRGRSRGGSITPAIRDRRATVLRTLCADLVDPKDWASDIVPFWVRLLAAFQVAMENFEKQMASGECKAPVSFAALTEMVRQMVENRASRGGWTGDDAAAFNAPGFAERVNNLLTCMKTISRGNCLYVTDNGRLGLGGEEISADGDWVYVLYQGRTPFVLRPRPGDGLESTSISRFRLISECYVDGLMEGEGAGLGVELERLEME
jgi:hypothetical protein